MLICFQCAPEWVKYMLWGKASRSIISCLTAVLIPGRRGRERESYRGVRLSCGSVAWKWIQPDCYFVCELCHHYYYYRMRQLSRERYALLLHYNPLARFWGRGSWLFRIWGRGKRNFLRLLFCLWTLPPPLLLLQDASAQQGEICPSTTLQSTCSLLGEGFLAIQNWGEGGSVISSDSYFVCELCHHYYYYYRMRRLSRERYALFLLHYNKLADFWGRGSWLFRIGGRGEA